MKVVHKIDAPPGPAGRWLIERLAVLGRETEAQTSRSPQNRPMPGDLARQRKEPSLRRERKRRRFEFGGRSLSRR